MKWLTPFLLIVAFLAFIFVAAAPAYAANLQRDVGKVLSGTTRVVLAPLQIPLHAVRGTMTGPPIIGTVGGLFKGIFGTIVQVVGGTTQTASGALPYAKYAAIAL